MIYTHGRGDLQPDLVTELVDAHDLVNCLALLPTNSDLVTWDNVPVLDPVLWFCRLDNGIPEGHPPFPMTVVREEMTEAFGIWTCRPRLEDLVPPEHFCDRHWWLVLRRRVQIVGNAQSGDGQPEELLALKGRGTNREKQRDGGVATLGPIRIFLDD